MAAKKKTTKKAIKKAVSTKKRTKSPTKSKKAAPKQEYTSHEQIDLDVKTPEQAANIIAHLKQLQMTAGWLIMKKMLELNMAVLEKAIVKKVDPQTEEKLNDAEVDDMRKTYDVYEELLGKPEQLITMFTADSATGVPSYDPYATTVADKGVEYAGVLEEQ
jgi:hypothetical protein